jgi:hypothetical protein
LFRPLLRKTLPIFYFSQTLFFGRDRVSEFGAAKSSINNSKMDLPQFLNLRVVPPAADHTTMAIGDDGMDLLSRVWKRVPPSPHNTKDTAILIDSDSDDDSVTAIVVAPPATTAAANDANDDEGSKKPAAANTIIDARSATSAMAEPMMLSSKSTTPSFLLASQTMQKFSSVVNPAAAAASSFAHVAEAAADSIADASDTKAGIVDLQSKFDSAQAHATATATTTSTSSSLANATSSMVDKKIKAYSGSTVAVAPATSTTTTPSTKIISKVKDEARVLAAARKVSLSPTSSNVSSTHSRTATPVMGESIPPPAMNYEDEDNDDENDESNYTYATYLANQQSLAAITSSSAYKPFRCNHCSEQFLTRQQVRQHAKTCKQRLESKKMMQMTTPPGGGDAATLNAETTISEDADTVNNEKEPEGVEEAAEEPDEITYTRYRPVKLNFGKDHPG